MLAETGSGKTRAIPKFLGTLQGRRNIRFTLALGLRTLTHQSGIAYKKELGFGENNVSVLVGGQFHDEIYSDAEELVQGDNEEEYKEAETDIDLLLSQNYDFDSLYPVQLAGPLRAKPDNPWTQRTKNLARMLQSPILVCTIDHLMAGLVSARATDSKRLNRILSHDLVIDEIDSFDTKDLLAIARLVHLAASAGRKVLISSATMPPVVAELLYRSYIMGFEKFKQVCPNSTGSNLFTTWLSHEPGINLYYKKGWKNNWEEHLEEFKKRHRNVIEAIKVQLNTRPVKHKVEFLDLDYSPERDKNTDENIQLLSSALSGKINALHRNFRVSKNAKSVSVGLLRISNTFDAMRIFNQLVKEHHPANVKRLFIFYQANLARNILGKVEKNLNTLLVRKHGNDETDPIFFQPQFLEICRHHEAYNDFQIIVVATPIEEVGRDHDFDWAILEPTSNWSTIQTAGRVWRHRMKYLEADDPANIVLLPYTCKTLFNKKGMPPYSCPGPVNSKHVLLSEHAHASTLFPQEIENRLDARFALSSNKYDKLTAPTGRYKYKQISDIEDGCIRHEMKDLLKHIQMPLTCFTTYYERLYPFRDTNGSISINFSIDEDGIRMHEIRLGRKVIKEKHIDTCVRDFTYADWKDYGDLLLLEYDRVNDFDTLECKAYIAAQGTNSPVQLFVPAVKGSLLLYYNDVVGGCIRRTGH